MSALGHERFFSAANRSQHVRHGARTDRRCAQEMRHSCGHARLSEGRSGISAAPQPRMAVTPRGGAQPAPQPRRRGRTELGESRRRVCASGAVRRREPCRPLPTMYGGPHRSPSRCGATRPAPPAAHPRPALGAAASSIPRAPPSPRAPRDGSGAR